MRALRSRFECPLNLNDVPSQRPSCKALTALGFTDDAKLERVLGVLMPRVIDQMASQHASTKKKVMEILSHVNKRLKAGAHTRSHFRST
jgi:hypothetical protein